MTANPLLQGTKVLVVGIANEHSIAYGCAKAFRELGADLAITYLNEKSKRFVEPLAQDRDGRLHYITVKTNVRGAEIRARRTVIIPGRD